MLRHCPLAAQHPPLHTPSPWVLVWTPSFKDLLTALEEQTSFAWLAPDPVGGHDLQWQCTLPPGKHTPDPSTKSSYNFQWDGADHWHSWYSVVQGITKHLILIYARGLMDGLGQDRHVSEPNLKEGLLKHRLRIWDALRQLCIFQKSQRMPSTCCRAFPSPYECHNHFMSKTPLTTISK